MNLRADLEKGLQDLDIEASDQSVQKLLAYVGLLLKWNRVYNLTAVRQPDSVLALHLLDSLAVLGHLPPGPLADVGSGAGLPGIPLAICQPDRPITLLESNQKKSAFQTQVRMELGLQNLSIACERAEKYPADGLFDVVISRAFSSLSDFAALAGHLLSDQGHLAAMKGTYPEAEIADLPPEYCVEQCIPLSVPGVEGERHLILMRRRKVAL